MLKASHYKRESAFSNLFVDDAPSSNVSINWSWASQIFENSSGSSFDKFFIKRDWSLLFYLYGLSEDAVMDNKLRRSLSCWNEQCAGGQLSFPCPPAWAQDSGRWPHYSQPWACDRSDTWLVPWCPCRSCPARSSSAWVKEYVVLADGTIRQLAEIEDAVIAHR